jgi:hypothetical protein
MVSSRAPINRVDPFAKTFIGLTDLIIVAATHQAEDSPSSRINPHAAAYAVLFDKIKNDVCQKNDMSLPPSAKRLFHDNQILNPEFFTAARQLEPIERVEYDSKGRTKAASTKSLEIDAKRRGIRQSELLAKNMAAGGLPKPKGEVDAHHVVSVRSKYASASRVLLYGWGIGVNDVDNGVFLPRNRKVQVINRRLHNATKHSVVHTRIYHVAVFFRLGEVNPDSGQEGREKLRGIKLDLLAGTFPYRKGEEL